MTNIRDYLERFYIGDESFFYSAEEHSQNVIDYINGDIDEMDLRVRWYTVRDLESLQNIDIQLKSEFSSTHYVSVLHIHGNGDNFESSLIDGENVGSLQFEIDLPKRGHNTFVVIISTVPFHLFQNDSTLLETESIIAGVIAIEAYVPVDIGEVDLPVINPNDFIETLTINNGQTDIKNIAVDRSVFIEEMMIGVVSDITKGRYGTSEPVNSLELTLKSEYQNHYISYYRVVKYEGMIIPFDIDISLSSPLVMDLSDEIPYTPVDAHDIIFILSPLPFDDVEDYNTLVAFGIGFSTVEEEEEPDVDLPPIIVNPTDLDSTQFIEVLDGTSLNHYSYVPDVYNVKISQTINGPYTLSFNLQPYTNASNIYTPRIIKCDNDYFHVQQITKRSQLENVEMDILCEHVSYELNYPPASFWDEVKQDYVWTEDTYKGSASEILEELLNYNIKRRFTIGTVDNDMTIHTFKTSSEGFRTRINEFASQIGLEVRWNKFTVSLLRKRGRDHGLTLQVGKNIIGLTEIIDTVKLGQVKRSYEIEALDLNYVYNELDAPLEAHNIVLGDVVTLVDDNYLIQRKDRVVSITYDVFQKALPVIEFSNNVAGFTSDSSVSGNKTVATDLKIYQDNIYRSATGNAFGERTRAEGDYTFAEGRGSVSYGENSHSEGHYTTAEGNSSHAEGRGSEAIGDYSHSEGYYTIAQGLASHSEGYMTEATYMSHAEGRQTMASGWYSHSEGYETEASGDAASAHGFDTIANGAYTLVCGIGNKEVIGSKPIGFADTHDQLFVLGNGITRGFEPTIRSNAFSIRRNGYVHAQGQYSSTGADYAEYFEWLDGNPNDEDRKGFAVTVEGDKIRLANVNDEYILGVVSVNPSVVGNNYEDQWKGMYIVDEWGSIEHHYLNAPFEEIDENGDVKIVYRQSYVPKVNPDYNENEPYVPRSQRKEWSAIGMLGKLLVRDDGTCQINKYAKLSETVDGILSHSDTPTQFFILRRISENVVEVLIK